MKQKKAGSHTLLSLLVSLFVFFWPLISPSQENSPLSNEFESWMAEGTIEYRQGRYFQAIELYNRCLGKARVRGDVGAEIDCLKKLGLAYWNTGQIEEFPVYYSHALTLSRGSHLLKETEDCRTFLEIFSGYTEGLKYRSLGQNEEAVRSFRGAIQLAEECDSIEFEIKCCRQLGLTYWNLSRLEDFYVYNFRALELSRRLHHKSEEGKCLINIGLYYQKMENYSQALIHYRDALNIARSMESKTDEAACLNNIGILYRRIGNFTRSLDCLKRALSLDVELGNRVFISQDMNNIGSTFRQESVSTGDGELMQDALDFYLESLKIARASGDRKTEIEVLNNIGMAYTDLEDYDSALKYFQRGVSRTEGFPYSEARCMILNNTARLYLDMGVTREAEKLYKQAIDLGLLVDRSYILWEAYYGLGQCQEIKNEVNLALESYTRSLTYIDRIRTQISLDAFKAGFVRDKIEVYESLISLLYRSGQRLTSTSLTEKIFRIIERAKARAFLESLGKSRVDVFKQLSPELERKEKEINSKISLYVNELSEPNLTSDQRKTLHNRLEEAEEEYILLLSRIRSVRPDVFDLFSSEPVQLDRIQRDLLDSETAVVEYFLGDEKSYGLVITNSFAEIFTLPSRGRMKESLRAYLKILSDPPLRRKFRGGPAAFRLYECLFSPVAKVLPGSVKNLLIVPDGLLYYLPFETLKLPAGRGFKEGDFLIQRYQISYAPSCSSLLFLLENTRTEPIPISLLAVGCSAPVKKESNMSGRDRPALLEGDLYPVQGYEIAPLPYSSKEARNVAKFFPKAHRSVLLGKEANEEALKKLPLEEYRVIHFACHGVLDERLPFRSALVLSRGKNTKEDGFLQVREIYSMRMNAEMIVLSACQTGKGKLERGEGTLGLPRIFFYTGARSVLTSLWRINDKSTAKFMNRLYDYMFQGYSKAEALRLAKLRMIQSRFSHPYYWAAYVLNGDYASPLVKN
ncbi:MAG: CHAT domain-containing protein [Candidatus Aminicenantes bacterium]